MRQVELHYGAATDVGLVRRANQDSYLADPPVFVVADGMGGHDGGEVASAIVVEEFARIAAAGYDATRAGRVVADTLREAQRRIREYAARQRTVGGRPWQTGTTAVVALLVEDEEGLKWLLANLGDSRIYRFAGGRLRQVSVDHSVVQELIDAGRITQGEAAVHPDRHVITRALGGSEGVEADYFILPLAEAERLILCSDGVTGMIDDHRIALIMAECADPRDAADRVVAEAVDAGGRDNATAVVVDVVGLVDEHPYDSVPHDSEQQRVSLDQKPGALP